MGRITKVWELEGSDKMYAEEVDIGNGVVRGIASGLRKFVTIDKMQGAMVCVLANLAPKNMLKKFDSHGMVLAAETPDKSSIVELLSPPEGSEPGDLIFIEGFERKPVAVLSKQAKTNEFFTIADKFTINAEGLAEFDGHPIKTEKGQLRAATVKSGIIA